MDTVSGLAPVEHPDVPARWDRPATHIAVHKPPPPPRQRRRPRLLRPMVLVCGVAARSGHNTVSDGVFSTLIRGRGRRRTLCGSLHASLLETPGTRRTRSHPRRSVPPSLPPVLRTTRSMRSGIQDAPDHPCSFRDVWSRLTRPRSGAAGSRRRWIGRPGGTTSGQADEPATGPALARPDGGRNSVAESSGGRRHDTHRSRRTSRSPFSMEVSADRTHKTWAMGRTQRVKTRTRASQLVAAARSSGRRGLWRSGPVGWERGRMAGYTAACHRHGGQQGGARMSRHPGRGQTTRRRERGVGRSTAA